MSPFATATIRYTDDPLGCLTSTDYSNGEQFQYAGDQVGNRTVQTRTITNTQVTSYAYAAANRLIRTALGSLITSTYSLTRAAPYPHRLRSIVAAMAK
jgi:hypothetical protein